MEYHLQNDLITSAVNSYNSSASIYDTDNVYTKGEIKKSSSIIFENDSDIEIHFSEYFKNYYNFFIFLFPIITCTNFAVFSKI